MVAREIEELIVEFAGPADTLGNLTISCQGALLSLQRKDDAGIDKDAPIDEEQCGRGMGTLNRLLEVYHGGGFVDCKVYCCSRRIWC